MLDWLRNCIPLAPPRLQRGGHGMRIPSWVVLLPFSDRKIIKSALCEENWGGCPQDTQPGNSFRKFGFGAGRGYSNIFGYINEVSVTRTLS